jgi:protein TonB
VNGSLRDVRILSTSKGGPLVPAKLINRVQPEYPEAARQLKIQGTVSVNVIVRKDGTVTVTVQNVGAGHPLLAPAAVLAVQRWRYEPTTVNGEPVDVQAKVYVTFALSNQANQQK